jgi:uncharacterized protein (TIGR02646 family)
MKKIIKNESPKFFEEWKKGNSYYWHDIEKRENFPIKKNLKRTLIAEQGYICCYCGQEIDDSGNTVLEHIKPREHYLDKHLEYTNLLASCKGGQVEREDAKKDGMTKREIRKLPLYCDASKGNSELPITPLDNNCEEFFVFGSNGEIFETNKQSGETIEILNLDNEVLRNLRKAAIEGFYDDELLTEEIELIIENLLSRDPENRFIPFCGAIVSYLKKLVPQSKDYSSIA